MPPSWTRLRRSLDTGTVLGTFLKLPATEAVDVVAAAFDFAVIDMEHSQLDEGEARRLVRHADAIGFPAVVRLPIAERDRVNRILEAGAAGIQISTVRRAKTITDTRRAMRYAPAGDRSISLGQPSAGYGSADLDEFLGAQREGPLLVAQIETAATDDPLEEIARAGADVLFIGSLDLRVELDGDAERLRERVQEIARVASAAGVTLGGAGIEDAALRYDVVGSDITILRSALVRAAKERRSHVRDHVG